MELWQQIILGSFFFYSVLSFLLGIQHIKKERYCNECYFFYLTGAFVWADAVVFGLFWTIVTAIIFFLQDFLLFLSFFSLFWVIRSLGETMYWFNFQFSRQRTYPFKEKWIYHFFKDEYVCQFVFQIIWQCLTAVSLFFAIFTTYLWFKSF